jgi:tRNA(His) 5'-end guanylyltransferase
MIGNNINDYFHSRIMSSAINASNSSAKSGWIYIVVIFTPHKADPALPLQSGSSLLTPI